MENTVQTSSLDLAKAGLQAAEDKKSTDNLLLDMRDLSPFVDYFVLLSGNTRTHTRALASAIEEKLKADHGLIGNRQGYRGGNWILIDFGNIVFHVFLDSERRFYNLEQLWRAAPTVYRNQNLD
jgi:ribosome-associated protein